MFLTIIKFEERKSILIFSQRCATLLIRISNINDASNCMLSANKITTYNMRYVFIIASRIHMHMHIHTPWHKHSPFLNTASYLKEQLTMTNPLLMVLHPLYGDLDQDWHLVTCHISIWCYAISRWRHVISLWPYYVIMQLCYYYASVSSFSKNTKILLFMRYAHFNYHLLMHIFE